MDMVDIQLFVERFRAELERLARLHREYAQVDDLLGEIWLASQQVGDSSEPAGGLSTASHASAVLDRLRRNLDRDRDRRTMASLEQSRSASEDGQSWIDVLPGDEALEPESQLLACEDLADALLQRRRQLERTYSEAAAYMLLLDHVEGVLADLAQVLALTLPVLRRRLARTLELHDLQSRLFDGISRIPASLLRHRWRPRRGLARRSGTAQEQLPLVA